MTRPWRSCATRCPNWRRRSASTTRRERLRGTVRMGQTARCTSESPGGPMDRHGWIDERLASVPLFANLDKKHLRQISSLATPIDVPEGKALTKEGDIGHEFIIVLEGEAEVKVGDDIVA